MSYPRIYFTNALVFSGGVNPKDTFQSMHTARDASYRSGLALKRHADTQHGGEVKEDCPACRDIQSRMEGLA